MSNIPAEAVNRAITEATSIVIIQADNPDGDSLASSLALEEILSELGKEVHLYCGVDIPQHLRYLAGWDRVERRLPTSFSLSIIVDTSSDTLLEQLELTNQKMWLKSKPAIVIDHHDLEPSIKFAGIYNKTAVATGEIIYELAKKFDWPLTSTARNMLATAIFSDSLGLTSEGTSARSIHIIAELVEQGVRIAELDAARREMMRRSAELVHYKGQLLQRVEYFADNRVATITIPWDEIEQFSHAYNPSMLVLDDMRLTENTDVAIAFKIYKDRKVTAKIRCNYGKGIGQDLASHFGGGGHPYASGFKIQDGRNYDDVKKACIDKAVELLEELDKDHKS